ncbi:uncharacterized protein LOC126610373 [Malus sylvestris]|uniref:uncharacterized protein LOC126610373 n=1 Tax=Malus sylvestris TaxID=3752 RepID=UPI0021ABCD85|nr:uncharacterized protein LOC126610373 [Malus sylvestris]
MDQHFEDQHSEELQFKEEELEGSTQRRRGPSIPSWKEQPCSFDSSGECISDNSSAFSRHVAAEVTDYRNISMVRDWRLIKEEDKEVFRNKIKDYVIFQEEDIVKMLMIRHMTLKIVEHAHKEYRNKFKKKNVLY